MLAAKTRAFVAGNPAVSWVAGIGAIVGLIVAFGHLDSTQAGYLSAIAAGVGTVITAIKARPVPLAVLVGGVGTVIQGLALFSVHVSSAELGALESAISLAVGIALHLLLVPVTTQNAGKQAVS